MNKNILQQREYITYFLFNFKKRHTFFYTFMHYQVGNNTLINALFEAIRD